MDITFVDAPPQLPGLAAALAAAKRVALDVEWRPTGLYDDDGDTSPASTLQLAVDGQAVGDPIVVYVVDLLAMNVRFQSLKGMPQTE